MNFGWRADYGDGSPHLRAREMHPTRRAEECEDHDAGRDRECRLPEVTGGEHVGRHQILGVDHELRPEDRRDKPARHHPRNRLGLELRARGVGRAEPVGHMRGRIEAAEERRGEIDPERSLQHRHVADEARERARNRGARIRDAAAEALGEKPHRQGAGPHADHHHGDRQGREAFVRREQRADDAPRRDDHRVVCARERLPRRQHQRIALGEPVAGGGIEGRFGERRHQSSPAGDSRRTGAPF